MPNQIYQVRQETIYRYNATVPLSQHVLRLQPRARAFQHVRNSQLEITPAPTSRIDSIDFFGNAQSFVRIEVPHTDLLMAMQAEVEVLVRPQADFMGAPCWEEIARVAASSCSLQNHSPVHFIYPTAFVPIRADIMSYCAVSFAAGRPIIDAVFDLTSRIHSDFAYDALATNVATPVGESFLGRAGVCQDFAHIMLSGLRALGVPAAYISGFLRTAPLPGQAPLAGAGATHAWIDVWCGEQHGWVSFDPTNGILVREDHIVLAVGRDYGDVSPSAGALRGYGDHSVSVSVMVKTVDTGATI